MKIALVIERMEAWQGGRETSTAQIAAALAGRGHDVTVVCEGGSCDDPSVHVQPLGRRGLLRFRRLRHFVAAVQDHIRSSDYQVVHSMLPIPGADVYQPRGGTIPGQLAASCRRRWAAWRLFVELGQPINFRRNLLGRLERELVDDPKALCLAVSEMVAQEFRQHYCLDARIRVVYNGVEVPDADVAQRADWRQRLRFQLSVGTDDPVFLVVAKNFALKGVPETIAAFARWHHSHHGRANGRLVVVGRELVEGYRRQAGLRDVGARVVFVPPTEEIFQWYAAADVCVLLSWYDPCSRVVLEALRWGIPSITTAYNGAAEALADGGGIVVDSPADTKAVAAAMDELADPQRRARCGEACRAVADSVSIDHHAEGLLAAYGEVARRR